MALIIIAMVLSNKGLFAQFTSFLQNGPQAPDATATSSGTALAPVNTAAQLASPFTTFVGRLLGNTPLSGLAPSTTITVPLSPQNITPLQ